MYNQPTECVVAKKRRTSFSHADCTKEMVDKSLVEVEKVFESQAV